MHLRGKVRSRGTTLASATAALILAPYLTVWLPFRTALYVQAATILLILLLLLVTAIKLGPKPLAGAWQERDPVLLGTGAYSAAAILGVAIGIARANEWLLIGGQFLSMALLPLGLAAGVLLGVRGRERWLGYAVTAAVGLASVLHLAHWVAALASRRVVRRLFFENSVSVVGPSLLGLLLALALWGIFKGPKRLGIGAATVLISLFIVGSGVRSLWLVTPVGIVLLGVFINGGKWLFRPTVLAGAALGALSLLGAAVGVHGWLDPKRPDALGGKGLSGEISYVSGSVEIERERQPAQRVVTIAWHRAEDADPPRLSLVPIPILEGGGFRLTLCLEETSHGAGYLGVQWLDETGQRLDTTVGRIQRDQEGGCHSAVGVAPDGTESARLTLVGLSPRGRWSLDDVVLESFESGIGLLVASQAAYLLERLISPVTLWAEGERGDDEAATILFRYEETARLIRLFHRSSSVEKMFGHGLGATFSFDTSGYDNRGNWVRYSELNYIHNFYAFLLFKLGIVGTLAVLSSLLLWVVGAWRSAQEPSAASGRVAAALAAALIAYSLWSISSPEILDFRMAPLWGLLLASTVQGGRSTPGSSCTGQDLPRARFG